LAIRSPTEANESVDLLVPLPLERHQVKTHAILAVFRLGHGDDKQCQAAVRRHEQALRIFGAAWYVTGNGTVSGRISSTVAISRESPQD